MKRFFLTGSLLVFITAVMSQTTDLQFEFLGSKAGLSQNNVYCILQDQSGFMWFGTKDGLNKYDGYQFTVYKREKNTPQGLSSNDIHSFSLGQDDKIWIGTGGGELNLMDLKTDQVSGKVFSNIKNILKTYTDSRGNIWIGTRGGGLYRFNPASKKITCFTQFNNPHSTLENDFSCITETSDGTLWLGTTDNGLYSFNPKTARFHCFDRADPKAGLGSNRIRFIFEDSRKNTWVGTYGGGLHLFQKNTNNFTPYTFPKNEGEANTPSHLLCMEEDSRGNLWVGTENEGLSVFDPTNGSEATYRHSEVDKESIGSNSIYCIKRDRAGNMWIGTSDAGINLVTNSSGLFTRYRHKEQFNSLSHNIVNSFFQDSNNNIWIGTDGGGINKFNEKTGHFEVFKHQYGNPNSICGNYVLSATQDRNGNIWMGTWGDGISVIAGNGRITHFKSISGDANSLSNNYAFVLMKDSKGRIWVGTYGGGLNRYDEQENKFVHFTHNKSEPQSISSNFILSLAEDKNGTIWIGTDGGGLNRLDETESHFISAPYRNAGISNDRITSIYPDAKGTLWLASDFGLNKFNPDSLKNQSLSVEDGLPSDVVTAVNGDKDGNIWVSTNSGISKLSPSRQITNYTADDGLQDGEFRQGSLLSRSGRMFFGGKNGFNSFFPEKIKKSALHSPVVFTGFLLFNKPVPVVPSETKQPHLKQVIAKTNSLTIPYNFSVISFTFSSLTFSSKDKIRYRYRLKGFDEKWQDLENKNDVTFTNLDPGHYTLEIIGNNSDGGWTNEPATLQLTVTPPFWKTWWFRGLELLLGAALILLIFYLRVSSIKKRNRILKRQVMERTQQLFEANSVLQEHNDKIQVQNIYLEESNKENQRKTEKIIEQQQHILSQKQRLEITVNELQQSNSTKDRLFSILAHDLNNPVTALYGISGVLCDQLPGLSKEEISKQVKEFYTASASIKELVANLLAWAGNHSKSLEYRPETFNIRELISRNIFLAKTQLHHKNISVTLHIDNRHQVLADPQMTDAIIRNLLGNAIKFTGKNGSISITTQELDKELSLSFKDSGIGMTEEQVKILLESENISFSDGTFGEKGIGLGLQIVKDFTKANKGCLLISSEKGKGSEFTLALPLSDEETLHHISSFDQASFQPEIAVFQNQYAELVKGKRILIVDDNEQVRNFLKLLLSGTFELFEANDGKEGLNTAKNTQPDMIITDMMMPELNGLEFCRQIKSDYNTSHIPVILITGNKDKDTQLQSFEAGSDACLTKPIDQKILFQLIVNLIRQQENIKGKYAALTALYPTHSSGNALDDQFLQTVTQYVEEHIDDPDLDYQKISQLTTLSRTVLYAKFKVLTGMGVHDFIKNIRLKASLRLLQEGRMNISQIAYEVGFATPSYFTKSFQKKYELSPREYIDSFKNKTQQPSK